MFSDYQFKAEIFISTRINRSWPWWVLPQAIKDIYVSPRLSFPWFWAQRKRHTGIARNRSNFLHAFTNTSEFPDRKKNLTSDKFWLLIAIVKNRLLPRYCSPATIFTGFPGISCLSYYEGKYEIIYDYPVVPRIHFLSFCSWFFHLHIRFR